MTPMVSTTSGLSAKGEGLFAASSGPVTGSVVYGALTTGTFTWTCPAGVTSVSVVAVGGGQGGSARNAGYPGNNSYFVDAFTCSAPGGNGTGFYAGTAYYNGGNGGGGGGGAAGYSGNGDYTPTGGAASNGTASTGYGGAGGGGGVGLYGQGTSGSNVQGTPRAGGNPGSGGGTGGLGGYGGAGGSGSTDSYGYGVPGNGGYLTYTYGGGGGGGAYGGGGGGGGVSSGSSSISGLGGALAYLNNYSVTPGNTYTVVVAIKVNGAAAATFRSFQYDAGGQGGSGAVRIIWPGLTRQFPSTNTGIIGTETYY